MHRSHNFYAKRNLHYAKKAGTWDGTMYGFVPGASPLKRAHRIRVLLTEFDSDAGFWKRRCKAVPKI